MRYKVSHVLVSFFSKNLDNKYSITPLSSLAIQEEKLIGYKT